MHGPIFGERQADEGQLKPNGRLEWIASLRRTRFGTPLRGRLLPASMLPLVIFQELERMITRFAYPFDLLSLLSAVHNQ
jgi:hypothetical protein